MTLTVLTDDQTRSVLENLTPGELNGFRDALVSALREYSASADKNSDGPTPVHQPERISVHSAVTGVTTLFMPSCNSAGHGVKGIPHPPFTYFLFISCPIGSGELTQPPE